MSGVVEASRGAFAGRSMAGGSGEASRIGSRASRRSAVGSTVCTGGGVVLRALALHVRLHLSRVGQTARPRQRIAPGRGRDREGGGQGR